MKTPDNFTPVKGAGFAFSYFTGYFALLELGRLQPHQTVLTTAGTSTTGLATLAKRYMPSNLASRKIVITI